MAEVELDAFLADSVTVAQGKLFALGAGWNRIVVALFPARHDRVGIGLLFRVPAGAPRASREFEVRVLGPSGDQLPLGSGPEGPLDRIRGEFTAGSEHEQIVPMALNLNGLQLPRPGDYRAIVSMDGQDVKSLAFRVEALPAQTRRRPPSSPETGTSGYL